MNASLIVQAKSLSFVEQIVIIFTLYNPISRYFVLWIFVIITVI